MTPSADKSAEQAAADSPWSSRLHHGSSSGLDQAREGFRQSQRALSAGHTTPRPSKLLPVRARNDLLFESIDLNTECSVRTFSALMRALVQPHRDSLCREFDSAQPVPFSEPPLPPPPPPPPPLTPSTRFHATGVLFASSPSTPRGGDGGGGIGGSGGHWVAEANPAPGPAPAPCRIDGPNSRSPHRPFSPRPFAPPAQRPSSPQASPRARVPGRAAAAAAAAAETSPRGWRPGFLAT